MVKSINTIFGIQGYKGDGKTTFATLLSADEYENDNTKTIYSNYKLNFPFKWLNPFDMLINIGLFENSVVVIDELHDYADSRDSTSFQNRYISSWFLKSRHTSTNVIYTTQFLDQIDKRIRRITDVDILIQNMYIDSDNDGDDDVFQYIIYDNRTRCFSDTNTFYAKPIFKLFDSAERINPFVISKEKKKKILEILEQLNEEKYNENKYNNDSLNNKLPLNLKREVDLLNS